MQHSQTGTAMLANTSLASRLAQRLVNMLSMLLNRGIRMQYIPPIHWLIISR